MRLVAVRQEWRSMHTNIAMSVRRSSKFPTRTFADNWKKKEKSFGVIGWMCCANVIECIELTDNGNRVPLGRPTFRDLDRKWHRPHLRDRTARMICDYPISSSWANHAKSHRIQRTSSSGSLSSVQWMCHSVKSNERNIYIFSHHGTTIDALFWSWRQILTTTSNQAPMIRPILWPTNVTNKLITKNMLNRNSSSGWLVMK